MRWCKNSGNGTAHIVFTAVSAVLCRIINSPYMDELLDVVLLTTVTYAQDFAERWQWESFSKVALGSHGVYTPEAFQPVGAYATTLIAPRGQHIYSA